MEFETFVVSSASRESCTTSSSRLALFLLSWPSHQTEVFRASSISLWLSFSLSLCVYFTYLVSSENREKERELFNWSSAVDIFNIEISYLIEDYDYIFKQTVLHAPVFFSSFSCQPQHVRAQNSPPRAIRSVGLLFCSCGSSMMRLIHGSLLLCLVAVLCTGAPTKRANTCGYDVKEHLRTNVNRHDPDWLFCSRVAI